MGKNSVINSLGRCIGNVAMHKILLEHTNKPESKKHLSDEITDYSADAFEKSKAYSWSDKEKDEIKTKAFLRVHALAEKYPDVKFKREEIELFVKEIMDEMML